MIDCPKCGFHQPKDRFCANCGVDMMGFSKAQRKSVGFYLKPWSLAIGALLIASVALIFLKNTVTPSTDSLNFGTVQLVEERVESFRRLDTGSRGLSSSETQPFSEEEMDPTAQGIELERDPQQAIEDDVSTAALNITLLLVPQSRAVEWSQLSSNFTAYQGFSAGVTEATVQAPPMEGYQSLLSLSLQDEPLSLPFFATIEDIPGLQQIGFQVDLDFEDSTLDLQIISVLPYEEPRGQEATWTEAEYLQRLSYDLKPGVALVVLGALPRPPGIPRTSPWNLPGLFELWDLEDFVSGEKELLLLIQREKNPL